MSPELRGRVAKEAADAKMVEAYKLSQQRTSLSFQDMQLVTRTPGLLHVRTTILRTRRSRLDSSAAPITDRLVVDLAERLVRPELEHPDGLEVVEWAVETQSEKGAALGKNSITLGASEAR